MQINRWKYSLEEITNFWKYYQNGHTKIETANHFSISYKTMLNYFLRLGWYKPTRKKKKITKQLCINPNYFQTIDSNKKAYFLGLLMSDGYICENVYSKEFGIALQSSDKYILEELQKEIAPLKKINHYKNSYKFSLANNQIYNDLKKYGIKEQKSNIDYTLPKLEDKYMHAFIRGYFDGDGCITIKSTGYSVVSFCCNSKVFLENLKLYLESKNIMCRNIVCEQNSIRKKPIYVLYLSKRENQLKFQNFIYSDKEIYLTRKYNKFMKIPR